MFLNCFTEGCRLSGRWHIEYYTQQDRAGDWRSRRTPEFTPMPATLEVEVSFVLGRGIILAPAGAVPVPLLCLGRAGDGEICSIHQLSKVKTLPPTSSTTELLTPGGARAGRQGQDLRGPSSIMSLISSEQSKLMPMQARQQRFDPSASFAAVLSFACINHQIALSNASPSPLPLAPTGTDLSQWQLKG